MTYKLPTLTAAFLTLSAMGTLPAVAGTLSFNYQGSISGNATFSPEAAQFLPVFPDLNFDFSEAIAGKLEFNDDPEQFLDGDITLSFDLFDRLSSWLSPLPNLSDRLNINFEGIGTFSSIEGTSPFTFTYVNALKAITIDDFNPSIVGGCLIETCSATGEGNLDIFYNFRTPFGTRPFRVASGSAEITATTTPNSPPSSVPEPTVLIGLLGIGSWMLKNKRLRSNQSMSASFLFGQKLL